MRLSEISVERPVLALVISLLLLVVGLVSLSRLWPTIREMPDVSPPVVSVETLYRGASAEIMETKITQPIEERISGIEGVDKLRSQSLEGRSIITIEFDLNRDIDAAANDVRDRVARVVAQLPEESDPPQVVKSDTNAEPIIVLALLSETMSPLQLTDFAERNIVDRLSAVPGVARVNLSGARHYAMRIWLNAESLAARRLTVADVEAALRRENVQLPAGRIESAAREFVLNTANQFNEPDDFRQIVIGRNVEGAMVRLGDVAQVVLAADDERNTARVDGAAGVTLQLEPQSNANALTVAKAVRAELAIMNSEMPKGTRVEINTDRAVFIQASMREVLIALVISTLLVLVVLYLFLGTWRATLIPAVTIPVSIIGTCTALYALGFSINTLTLLGVVLAIGLVVDDAIVVLENIYRRMETGEKSLLAAIDGSREIGFAVIATTLVLSAVFVPISFLTGRVGRLFGEFGLTLAAAILISCLIALTLTPMMASQLFADGVHRGGVSLRIDRLFAALAARYRSALEVLLPRAGLVVGAAALALLGAGFVYAHLPVESVPEDDRGLVRIVLTGPEGTSLAAMTAYADRLDDIMNAERVHGDIERIQVRIPGGGGTVGDVNRAQGSVLLKPWSERKRSAKEIAASLRKAVQAIPGVRASVSAPSGFNWGGQDPVRAVLMGPDYKTLAQWRDKIIAHASTNPGLLNVDSDYKERKPHMVVFIDRNRAADLGISLDVVGRTLETMLASRTATTFLRDGREYDVILQGSSANRASPSDLDNIYVRPDRGGALVPLASIVTLQEDATATQLNRFNRLRAVTITAGLAPDYAMGSAVQYFRDIVKSDLPASARLDFDGESREYLKSSQSLYWTFLGALVIVFLVLAAQFESFTLPMVIMSTVPLALIGAVLGLWLYGASVNIFSQIAVVMLIGLAAKNGVLIVEFANQLRDRGTAFNAAIVEAAVTRLRPVLMTSLCSAFGALPLLLARGAGAETRQPIGIVVLYGVGISLVLTLFVVPAVYRLVARGTRSPEHWLRIINALRGQRPATTAGVALPDAPGAASPGAASPGAAHAPHD